MLPVISALFAFVASLFPSRPAMQLKILALQHQVAIYKHTVARPRLRPTASSGAGFLGSGLSGKTPWRSRTMQPPSHGQVIAVPEVGGLHHHYGRVAA